MYIYLNANSGPMKKIKVFGLKIIKSGPDKNCRQEMVGTTLIMFDDVC